MSTNLDLHRQRAVILLSLPALLALATGLPAQLGLGLAPMRLEFRLAPGGQHSGPLNLTNDSPAKQRVRAELLDFSIDENETPQFERALPRESEYSCRQWLSLNPMEAEVSPGATIPVRYTLRVPAGISERSYHCAAGFTTLPAAEQVSGTGLKTAVRIVAAFYVVVGQPPIVGGFKEMRLEYVPDPKQPGWRATVILENRGLMHFRPSGELAVLDAEGQVLETVNFQPLPVLPQREQRFLFPLKVSLVHGKYTLRARVDLGAGEIQEATANVAASLPGP